jgi:hypothetical protein
MTSDDYKSLEEGRINLLWQGLVKDKWMPSSML